MSKFVFEALGTFWIIKSYTADLSSELKAEITAMILDFEHSYSRFIPSSFISKLNKSQSLNSFPQELYEILVYSENLRILSAGAFNLAVCNILVHAGYGIDHSIPGLEEDIRNPFQSLEPDYIALSKNIQIDIGGIGKGWLVDKVASLLRTRDITNFVINAGGDIYASSDNNDKIECALENPFNEQEFIGSIKIKNAAIACSSQNRRYWKALHDGSTFAHIIDPQTRKPARGIAAVFTEAKDTKTADAVSTALFAARPFQYQAISRAMNCEYAVVYENGSYMKSANYQGTFNTLDR